MRTISVSDARTHLSRLLGEIAAVETIVIAKRGRPVATLSPQQRMRDPNPREVVEAMRELEWRHHITTGGKSVKQMIEEDRP